MGPPAQVQVLDPLAASTLRIVYLCRGVKNSISSLPFWWRFNIFVFKNRSKFVCFSLSYFHPPFPLHFLRPFFFLDVPEWRSVAGFLMIASLHSFAMALLDPWRQLSAFQAIHAGHLRDVDYLLLGLVSEWLFSE